jgi:hypothetical protein
MGHRAASPLVAALLAVLLGGVLLLPAPTPAPVARTACDAVAPGATATPASGAEVTGALVTVRSGPQTSTSHGGLPATSPAESRCPEPPAFRPGPGPVGDVVVDRARVSSRGSRAPPVATS